MLKVTVIMVSIIVPVYNSALYLDKCISSAVVQTHKDIEIILVNDGSKDESSSICHAWAKIDSRITVIDKPNGGVSSARNAGLKTCRGDYIVFLDSDDYLEPEMIESMLRKLISVNAEIAFCGFRIFADNGKQQITCSAYTSDVLTPREAILQCFQKRNTWFYAGWAKFYSRGAIFNESCMEPIYFDESLSVGEDYKWLMNVLSQPKVSCIACLDKVLYNYRRFSENPSLSNFRSRDYLFHKEALLKADQQVSSLFKLNGMGAAYACSIRKMASEYTNGEVIIGSYYGYGKLREYTKRHKEKRFAIYSLKNGIENRVKFKTFAIHVFMLLPWPRAILRNLVKIAEKKRSNSLVL